MVTINQCYKRLEDKHTTVGNGWSLAEDGVLTIQWTSREIMPSKLIDVLADESDDQAEKETEYDYERFENEVEEDFEVDSIINVIFDDDQDD